MYSVLVVLLLESGKYHTNYSGIRAKERHSAQLEARRDGLAAQRATTAT